MNEPAAVSPARYFPTWTIVASLLPAVRRAGNVEHRKRTFGALRIVATPRVTECPGSAARTGLLPGPCRGLERGVKRAMDIILSALALIALAPLLAAVAAALSLEFSGGLIVREKRFGPGGHPITLFKFRSMHIESCDVASEHSMHPCLTPIGRVLRQLSLDKLPQLINVLRGEMSLVGPRPHPLRTRVNTQRCSDAAERYYAWHLVKPGITGWAQINGSGDAIDTIGRAQRRADLDLWYLEHWSIWLDIQIIVRTALNGLRPESLD